MSGRPLSLFEAYGIEIEIMVVDAETLDVRSVVDELLRSAAGTDDWPDDYDDGPIGWSNELVTHVVELKTNGPAPSFAGLADAFLASTRRMSAMLAEGWDARLLPSGMHPWMSPATETRIWPHAHGEVYGAYDRLFDCRRHGWANLQSVHLNLPFADEHEFGRLMAATRLALPLIPALAASSPIVEGRATGILDNRLEHYRTNSARVPAITGEVIPEPVFGFAEYEEGVLGAIDRGLAEAGSDSALRGAEWANARGAITRFDRMAIEIRLIDAQECAAADLAVACAVASLVRALVEERWCSYGRQRRLETRPLARALADAARDGADARLLDRDLAAAFGWTRAEPPTLGKLWNRIAEQVFDGPAELGRPLELVLRAGPLAARILRALGPGFDRARLRAVYGELAECLVSGRCLEA